MTYAETLHGHLIGRQGSRRALNTPALVLDGARTVRLPPAAAVAFDDQGGLWAVDGQRHVTRSARP